MNTKKCNVVMITTVEVQYEKWTHFSGEHTNTPTIESLKVNHDNTINIKLPKDSWSREEVATLCMKIQHETTKYKESCHFGPNVREIAEWTNKWLEENL